MIIYKAHKDICYIKRLEITENIINIEAGYRPMSRSSYFYKNFLGVIIDLETGYPQINKSEAKEDVEERAKKFPTFANEITCPFLDEKKLVQVKEVSRKEFKKIKTDIKHGNFNI